MAGEFGVVCMSKMTPCDVRVRDDAVDDDASREAIPPLLDAATSIGLTTGVDDGAEDEDGEGGGGLHPV
jgi:hypothetical protein